MSAAVVSAQHQQQNGLASSSPATAAASKQYLTVNQVLQRSRVNDPTQVKRMNVSGSALEDVSVMDQFPCVEVCSFAVNDISDLEPFRHCARLQELYLRKNRIADFSQLLHLSHLPLRSVGLADNPITSHPEYRLFVISALPQLRKLDDAEVTPSERQEAEQVIPDPFAAAEEMGVASMPPMAGRPSSTAVQGNMLNTSPLSASRQQQQQQSSPYDAFANTASSSKAMANTNNNAMMRQPRFDDVHQQQQLSSSSPPSLNMMMNNKNTSKPPASDSSALGAPSNRYNGDDVPIGGGGGGGLAMMTSSKKQATPTSTSSTLAQKRAQMRQQQQQREGQMSSSGTNDFYTQEIKVAVPGSKRGGVDETGTSSSSRPTTPSAIENTHPSAFHSSSSTFLSKQQKSGGCGTGTGRNYQDPSMTMTNNKTKMNNNNGNNFSEDAAVQAVKVLLGGMSEGGIAQIKRYLNTI